MSKPSRKRRASPEPGPAERARRTRAGDGSGSAAAWDVAALPYTAHRAIFRAVRESDGRGGPPPVVVPRESAIQALSEWSSSSPLRELLGRVSRSLRQFAKVCGKDPPASASTTEAGLPSDTSWFESPLPVASRTPGVDARSAVAPPSSRSSFAAHVRTRLGSDAEGGVRVSAVSVGGGDLLASFVVYASSARGRAAGAPPLLVRAPAEVVSPGSENRDFVLKKVAAAVRAAMAPPPPSRRGSAPPSLPPVPLRAEVACLIFDGTAGARAHATLDLVEGFEVALGVAARPDNHRPSLPEGPADSAASVASYLLARAGGLAVSTPGSRAAARLGALEAARRALDLAWGRALQSGDPDFADSPAAVAVASSSGRAPVRPSTDPRRGAAWLSGVVPDVPPECLVRLRSSWTGDGGYPSSSSPTRTVHVDAELRAAQARLVEEARDETDCAIDVALVAPEFAPGSLRASLRAAAVPALVAAEMLRDESIPAVAVAVRVVRETMGTSRVYRLLGGSFPSEPGSPIETEACAKRISAAVVDYKTSLELAMPGGGPST